jgi:hypothetical protein
MSELQILYILMMCSGGRASTDSCLIKFEEMSHFDVLPLLFILHQILQPNGKWSGNIHLCGGTTVSMPAVLLEKCDVLLRYIWVAQICK